MGSYKADFRGHVAQAVVLPERGYIPLTLIVRAGNDSIEMELDEEQLGELEYAIRRYRQMTRAHETPDQQQIYAAELDRAAEEIAV